MSKKKKKKKKSILYSKIINNRYGTISYKNDRFIRSIDKKSIIPISVSSYIHNIGIGNQC